MINRNYQMDSISVNICQASKDYENVTTISGNENEFPEKTSKVIFHSSVNSLCLDSAGEADKKAEDDVCVDKNLPIGHDIDQDDKEDNGNVSDGANKKVIIENETVDMDQTGAKTTPLETEKPVMEEIQVPSDHASSKIPKYIHKSKLRVRTSSNSLTTESKNRSS